MNKKPVAGVFLIYLGFLCLSVVAYLYLNSYGKTLFPVDLTVGRSAEGENLHRFNHVLHVLLALAVVIATARVVGKLFSYIGQPTVIGEVIGGILLGPSLLGKVAPDVSAYVLPPTVSPFLEIIAQLGIILYMFLVGVELDLKVLKKSGHATLAISHVSIAFPFILGSFLSLYIYESFAPEGVDFTSFSLFLGVSMSITAFPVLARILTDKGINKSSFGVIALTCAAIDDVTAWCLLALVVSITNSSLSNVIVTVSLTILYIAFMFIVARPIVARAAARLEKSEHIAEGELAVICLGILVSALATEYIGIHAIFGAFLLGAIVPHQSKVAADLTFRLQDLVQVLFLPAFFAFTGMRTEIGLLETSNDWLMCGLIILTATLGKFGGTLLVAKIVGYDWRESAGLGVLMNTRGLVELIVLNIGLDLGIIDPHLFTMLVIMALVTTFVTGPALRLILGKRLDLYAQPTT